MPGSLASSAASSSMTDNRVSDRKLEWQREASRGPAGLFLIQLPPPPLRVAHRGQYQVLQHFGIRTGQDAGVDLHPPHLAPAVYGRFDHAAASRAGNDALGKLALH